MVLDRGIFAVRDGQQVTLYEGRVGPGVVGVSLVLADGTKIVTTTGNGCLLAWSPGTQGVRTADVATPSGLATAPPEVPSPAVTRSG
jgi:hypothetical protein